MPEMVQHKTTVPHVSTICLMSPHVSKSPMLQAIKDWRWGRPGNKTTITPHPGTRTHIHTTHRGEIAGIAVGGIVLLAIVGGVILMVGYLYYKSRFANPKVIDSVSCCSYILI